MKNTLPDRVRLGAFEVDLRAGELLDGNRKVCLREQTLFILRMLVESRGEIVNRAEL
jgi:DNA-binding winged helix-turn-helix (wHTH) protein